MPKKKTKLENTHLSKLIGKSSYLEVKWKSWKDELPPKGESLYIIIRLQNGFYSVTGEYMEEALPYGCDEKGNMVIPPRVWRYVIFHSPSLPRTFLDSKDGKRLIAWGNAEKYVPENHGKESCIICKEKRCVC